MFEQNNEIFRRFSNNSWILIDSKSFSIPDEFKLKSYTKWNKSDFTSLLDENDWKIQRFKIAVSPEINGYQIIDGEMFNYSIEKELLKLFSANCGLYYFHIDLWNPSMAFEFYEKGELKRNYKVYPKHDEKGDIDFIEESYGELLSNEIENLYRFPIEDSDYNYFWFPLRFMSNELGINREELNKAFSKQAVLIEISQAIKEKVKE